MSTTTTNLGLKKPAFGEPILITDINDNMDTLDSAVPAASKSAFTRGTALTATSANHFSVHTLCTDTTHYGVGRYYVGATAAAYIDDIPSGITGGFQVTVEEMALTNRFVITIVFNNNNEVGNVYKQWYTQNGWSSWFKFQGEAVT